MSLHSIVIPSSVGDRVVVGTLKKYRHCSLGGGYIQRWTSPHYCKVKPDYVYFSKNSNEHGRFLVLRMENTSQNTQEE